MLLRSEWYNWDFILKTPFFVYIEVTTILHLQPSVIKCVSSYICIRPIHELQVPEVACHKPLLPTTPWFEKGRPAGYIHLPLLSLCPLFLFQTREQEAEQEWSERAEGSALTATPTPKWL